MWQRIRTYLSFTRKERLGILVLLFVVLVLFVLPYFAKPRAGSRDERAFQQYAGKVREFRSSHMAAPEISPDSGTAGSARKKELFYFDPNRMTADEGQRLGLSSRLLQTIRHYRDKGGQFYRPDDLQKLYGLAAADYERLLPFVRISGSGKGRQRRSLAFGDAERPRVFVKREPAIRERREYPAGAFNSYRKKLEDIDINLADSAAWCRLPGIGIKLAARIVHFREKLGGFYAVDQVAETFGLPDSSFARIRPFLHVGGTALQKIDLNTAMPDVLQTHPYIRWKLARGILRYRDQHGGFKSVEEVQQLDQMEPSVFEKLSPYLEVR